jgi:hypothetical protein
MKRQLLLALTGFSLLTGVAYAERKPIAKDKAIVANVVDDEDDAKPTKVYFKNCTAARAAGYLDMHRAASLLMSNSQC